MGARAIVIDSVSYAPRKTDYANAVIRREHTDLNRRFRSRAKVHSSESTDFNKAAINGDQFKQQKKSVRQRSISQVETVRHLSNRSVITLTQSNSSIYSIAMQAVVRSDAKYYGGEFEDYSQLENNENKTHKKSKKLVIPYVIAAIVFLFSSGVSLQTYLANRHASEKLGVLGETNLRTDEQGVVEGTGDQPAEGEVNEGAIRAYSVAPDMPRYLRIPKLGVFSRIKALGETKEGAVDAPWNINDVGWYNGSRKPGASSGSSLLVGHVSGWTAPGVFKKLNVLGAGDQFSVELGSGEVITYEVTDSVSLPVEQINMGEVLSAMTPGQHDVKLMTCAGRYDRSTDHYEERRIVYAKRV